MGLIPFMLMAAQAKQLKDRRGKKYIQQREAAQVRARKRERAKQEERRAPAKTGRWWED